MKSLKHDPEVVESISKLGNALQIQLHHKDILDKTISKNNDMCKAFIDIHIKDLKSIHKGRRKIDAIDNILKDMMYDLISDSNYVTVGHRQYHRRDLLNYDMIEKYLTDKLVGFSIKSSLKIFTILYFIISLVVNYMITDFNLTSTLFVGLMQLLIYTGLSTLICVMYIWIKGGKV